MLKLLDVTLLIFSCIVCSTLHAQTRAEKKLLHSTPEQRARFITDNMRTMLTLSNGLTVQKDKFNKALKKEYSYTVLSKYICIVK